MLELLVNLAILCMYIALIKKATCEAVFKCRKAGMGSGLIFHIILLYSGKLSREKTFVNFTVCGYLRKFSLENWGRVLSFGVAKASNI